MKWLKEYRLIVMGGLLLFLVVVIGRGGREPATPVERENPFLARPAAAPAVASTDSRIQPAGRERHEPQPDPKENQAGVQDRQSLTEDADADQAAEEADDKFDAQVAKLKATEEVKSFNKELASALRNSNPNALKTRLKATELKEKAEELDQWIKTQDSRTDMTLEERQEWQAQREVWAGHSKDLKQVAQRLTATRGTKRKVRILAQEISERGGE